MECKLVGQITNCCDEHTAKSFDDKTVDTSRAASLFSVTCGSMNPIPLHPKMPWWRFCVMEFKLYISGKSPVFWKKWRSQK